MHVCVRERERDRERKGTHPGQKICPKAMAAARGPSKVEAGMGRLSQALHYKVGSSWYEGPAEHQAQSFAKLDTPGVLRAGQAGEGLEECGGTDSRTHTSGRMEDGGWIWDAEENG